MNKQALGLNDFEYADSSMVRSRLSFAAVLRRGLTATAWSRLTPAITIRFAPYLRPKRPLRFSGTMHWVYCSPMGSFISRLLKRFSILPHQCARNTAFDFVIALHKGTILKQRRYELAAQRPFTFTSTFSEHPRLHEEFGGGIGMYLKLEVKRGALLFRDQGYFVRLGRWRLPLPRWLAVGRFELLHRNIDTQRFQIIIRVSHPLLGTLFYQRGEFCA